MEYLMQKEPGGKGGILLMDVDSKPLSPEGPSRKMRAVLEPGRASERARNSIKKARKSQAGALGREGVPRWI